MSEQTFVVGQRVRVNAHTDVDSLHAWRGVAGVVVGVNNAAVGVTFNKRDLPAGCAHEGVSFLARDLEAVEPAHDPSFTLAEGYRRTEPAPAPLDALGRPERAKREAGR